MACCYETIQSFSLADWPQCDTPNKRPCLSLDSLDRDLILMIMIRLEHLAREREGEIESKITNVFAFVFSVIESTTHV
jgi:hypothetical protein